MLRTDWLKVCTEGRCIDGREVLPEWLTTMAKSYSPATYTAVLNSEHAFFPGLGSVLAVKAEKDEQGRMALYAQLDVTAELVQRFQNKRQQFFSIEYVTDFPEKGGMYLSGMAITDTPAAQGLPPTQFSTGKAPERLSVGVVADLGMGRDEEKPPRWFSDFSQQIRSWLSAGASLQPEKEPMTPEELRRMEALETAVKKLTTAPTAEEKKAAEDAQAAQLSAAIKAGLAEHLKAQPAAVTPEALAAQIKTVVDAAIKPVADEVAKLAAAEVGGTKPAAVTGEAGGEFKAAW